MATHGGIVAVSNETKSTSSRITREGKRITYRMTVIQQPERARACGSGAKSSADRRPVDPPPIVELRIFEGDAEITFSYNANFFLFATLENARNIAQGRVPAAPASFPVLTGTPVAGMAYLDRPQPAGYFIFPDLSVRHEGKYRLSFALYEELKDQKDMDNVDPQNTEAVQEQNKAHVAHRLEVKSAPFTVFSAKKFPGLTESTALSRMVAEQGCRVRIRRDVRMRRRENKTKNEWDEYEDETAYERARRTATPDGYGQPNMPTPQPMDGGDRARSVSNASIASFGQPVQRRTSLQDMVQGYQQAYGPPAVPQPLQNPYAPQMSYPAAQHHQYPAQYPPQQENLMQPPQIPYHQQPMTPVATPQTAQSAHYYSGNHVYPQRGYEQTRIPGCPMGPTPANGVYGNAPMEYRRASAAHQPQPVAAQMTSPHGSLDYSRSAHIVQPMQPMQPMQPPQMSAPQLQPMPQAPQHMIPNMAPTPSGAALSRPPLAPLKTAHLSAEKSEAPSPTYPIQGVPRGPEKDMGVHAQVASAVVNGSGIPPTPSYPGPRASPPKFANQPPLATGAKRSFSTTFPDAQKDQPLRQGARPTVSHAEPEYPMRWGLDGACDEPDEMESPMSEAAMMYRRADGTERRRRAPPDA